MVNSQGLRWLTPASLHMIVALIPRSWHHLTSMVLHEGSVSLMALVV